MSNPENSLNLDPETEPITTAGIETDTKDDSETSNIIEFDWGEALTPVTSMKITSVRPTRLVVLAGAVGSGKTTVISAIYELVQSGSIGPFQFAGSQTLLEFERISHDSRISSDRTKQITERTKRTLAHRLLHLAFAHKSSSVRSELLFTDITGEMFEEIRDSTEDALSHPLLFRADHFVALVDGAKLSNSRSRITAVNDVVHLLRRLLDAHILNEYSLVDILFTKMDLVSAVMSSQPGLSGFIEETKQKKLIEPFASCLGGLKIHEIAARPEKNHSMCYTYGHGLVELVEEWIKCHPVSRLPANVFNRVLPQSNRAIDNLGLFVEARE